MWVLLLIGATKSAIGQELGPFPPLAVSNTVDAVSNTVDEVIVRSRSLLRLQTEIFRAEDSFYAAFNALNSDHQFDIDCEFTAYTGTRIKQRVCRAKFVATLEAQAAEALLRGDPPPPTYGLMKAKGELLTEQMRSQVKQNPALLATLMNIATARESFDGERARRCESRLLFYRRH
jgi:hypothetical protein